VSLDERMRAIISAVTIQRVVGGKLTTYATMVVPDTLVAAE
jgi:hypothetical protein